MGLLSGIKTISSKQYSGLSKTAAKVGKTLKLPDWQVSEKYQKAAEALKPKPVYASSTRDTPAQSKVLGVQSKNTVPGMSSTSWGKPTITVTKPKTTTTSQSKSTSSNSGSGSSSSRNSNVDDYFSDEVKLAGQSRDTSMDMTDEEYAQAIQEGQQRLKLAQEEQTRGMSQLLSALEGAKSAIGLQRENAQMGYDNDIQSAQDSAQQVERRNRNTLRALGILGSSAAGDILSRPWQEFDKQKANIGGNLRQTLAGLDQVLAQKTQEHADMVAELNSKYAQLISGINSDLAYTARERRAAKEQADLAYQQRLQEIKSAQLEYEMQVDVAKQNLPSYNGGLDLAGISGSTVDAGQEQSPQQVGVTINPEVQRREDDLYTPMLGLA